MEILSGLRNVVFNAGYISIPCKMLVSLAHNRTTVQININ